MRLRAGSHWLGREAALYGITAATWLGLDVVTDRAEFVVPRARRHLPPWMALHTTTRWAASDLVRRDGIRTCNATRAIIDMARSHSARTLEATIDSAIRLRATSLPTLSRRFGELRGSGAAGARLLQTLLLDSGGESVLERRFLRLMREAGLPRPATQVVHNRSGGRVVRVDFEFTDRNLVVEVSGRKGHSSDSDRAKDARRRNILQAGGAKVLEFTTGDVMEDPDYVIKSVVQHL
jgi:hypothetical protein